MRAAVRARVAVVEVMALVGVLLLPVPALATTTFTVTTTADDPDADPGDGLCETAAGHCSLRAAIEEGNALGVEVEVLVPAATLALTSWIEVTGDITVRGAGTATTSIVRGAGSGYTRLLQLAEGAALDLRGMTFDNTGGSDLIWLRRAETTLRLDDVHITNGAQALLLMPEGTASAAPLERVTLEVVRSRFTDVSRPVATGNLLDVALDIRHTTFVRPRVALLLYAHSGRFSVADSVILDTRDGRGIDFARLDGRSTEQTTLDVIRTEIIGTTNVDRDEHALRVQDLAYGTAGNQPTVATRVIDSTIADYVGNGVDVQGELLVDRSTIRGHTRHGINQARGPVTIHGSTISDNGPPHLDEGFWGGAVLVGVPAEIVNSTFSGNVNRGLSTQRPALLRNVTITGTLAREDGFNDGFGYRSPGGDDVVIENSVIVGNHLRDCWLTTPSVSGGHSADGDGTCPFDRPGDLAGIDPLLGPLADHGGPTLTHLPLTGSPLIDGGSNAICPAIDQRGAVRPSDGTGDGTAVCDIGAVEVGAEAASGDVEVRWEGDGARRGLLRADGGIDVTVLADPGATSAVAHIDVSSWHPDGDPAQPVLAEAAAVTVPVELGETSAGTYTGRLPLAGVERVDSITGVVAHGGSSASRTTTERLPAVVAGALAVTMESDLAPWMLPDAQLVVRSDAINDGDSLVVAPQQTVTTRWLRPSEGYVLQVRDGQGQVLVTAPDPVRVRGGLVTDVDLVATPVPFLPFGVRITDVNGSPLAGVRVTLTDEATGDQVAKTTTGADGLVSAVARGAGVTVEAEPGDQPYTPLIQPITLTAWEEVVDVSLGTTMPTATVSGMVTRPDRPTPAVAGARVSLTSLLADGRWFTTSTTTLEDGRYSAQVFPGTVRVVVDEPRAGGAERTEEVTGDLDPLDLELSGPVLVDLDIDLHVQFAGEELQPVELRGAAWWHYGLEVRDQAGRVIARPRGSQPRDMPVQSGETVQVCADGAQAGLPRRCVDVDVDPAVTAVARVELVQVGRIDALLTWEVRELDPAIEQYQPGWFVARLFRVDDDTPRLVGSFPVQSLNDPTAGGPQTARLLVPVSEPGLYRVDVQTTDQFRHQTTGDCNFVPGAPPCATFWSPWVHHAERTARVSLTVPTDTAVDLGEVPLAINTNTGFASPGSGTSISPGELLPGGTARLRVAATNSSSQAITGTQLRLEIPADTTLREDSVVLDGQPVAFTVTGGEVVVDTGTVEPGEQRVLTAWVEVDAEIDADLIVTRGRVTRSFGEEGLLGSATAVVRRLSIDASSHTAVHGIPVWGRSLPGAVVEVQIDGMPAATVTATPGGYWRASVTLPPTPLARRFRLEAVSGDGAGQVRSTPAVVAYDPTFPTLRRVVMGQPPAAVTVEFDPAEGVARFPFVWNPNLDPSDRELPIVVDLHFDNPDRVADAPVVAIGTVHEEARFDTLTKVWRAELTPGASGLGPVLVDWEPTAASVDLAPAEQQLPFSAEEVRAYLPPLLSTFTDLEMSEDPHTGAMIVTAALPDIAESATMRIEVVSEPAAYEPTEQDLALAASAGVQMYDLRLEVTEDETGLRVSNSVFIPDSALNQGAGTTFTSGGTDFASGGIVLASTGTPLTLDAVSGSVTNVNGVRVSLVADFEGVTTAASILGVLDLFLSSRNGFPELDRIVDQATNTCSPERAAAYRNNAERIAFDTIAFEFYKLTLGIVGSFAAPATFGWGTLAIWGLGTGMGYLVSQNLSDRTSRLADQLRNDPDCDEQPPALTPEREPCDRRVWFDVCDMLADPVWIHDPSGYVYEVFREHRLEGVTATLQHAPTDAGPWQIWDAEWFGQDNPLLTDDEGRYGWDVPEGWWRVRWDAEGYATAYSEVLRVLPPHFDVDVGLRSLAAPRLASASVTVDGVAEVTFDRWMLLDALDEVSVTLTDTEGELAEVTLSAPQAQEAANGQLVTKVVELDTAGPLIEGDTYTVWVDRMVLTAAEVPAGEDLSIEVVVLAVPIDHDGGTGDGDGGTGDGDGGTDDGDSGTDDGDGGTGAPGTPERGDGADGGSSTGTPERGDAAGGSSSTGTPERGDAAGGGVEPVAPRVGDGGDGGPGSASPEDGAADPEPAAGDDTLSSAEETVRDEDELADAETFDSVDALAGDTAEPAVPTGGRPTSTIIVTVLALLGLLLSGLAWARRRTGVGLDGP